MLNRELTDRHIVESILQTEKMEIEFEDAPVKPGERPQLKFTIFSKDLGDGRGYIFGEGFADEIWTTLRNRLEENNL